MVDNAIIQRIMTGPFAEFLATYKVFFGIALAFCYIFIVIVLGLNAVKLANAETHPIKRRQILMNILTAFICLVLLSCFTIFYYLVLKFAFA